MNSEDVTTGELSFEEAFARLEAAVARLESSGLSVDELVAEFESGMGLVKHCQRLLDAAQLRVAVLLHDEDAAAMEEVAEVTV